MKGRPRVSAKIRRLVESRAGGRCEYCRILVQYDAFPGTVDHIIAVKHGGTHGIENMAFCCARCNAHKGPNIAGFDQRTFATTRIFNPRSDRWAEHFRYKGELLVGITAIGRATIAVLEINHPYRCAARAALMKEGKY